MQAGRFDEADAAAQAFLAQPLSPERQLPALLWRGMAANQRGDAARARDLYEAARRIDRRNPQLLLQLGTIHGRLGDPAAAESCYREALRQAPRLAVAHYNLGVLLQNKRDLAGARRAYEAALLHEPRLHPAWLNLGNLLRDLKDDDNARRCYLRAIDVEPRFGLAHHALGVLAQSRRQHATAVESFRAALAADPAHAESWVDLVDSLQHLGERDAALATAEQGLAHHPANQTLQFKRALLAGETAASMPDTLIEKMFDRMAPEFDDHLVGRLGYGIPARLTALLGEWLKARGPAAVLDLGCGTGLIGVEVAAAKSRLVGVDLSANMVAAAGARGVYDELHAASIEAYFAAHSTPFDLIVAADVLVYVGALEALFAGVRARLAPGGRFAFSIESPVDLREGFRLLPTGRYAHAPAYVQALGAAHGMQVVTQEPAVIRMEAGAPIDGFVFVLGAA